MTQLRSTWRPRMLEDRLLREYWRARRGLMIVEVPIGGVGSAGRWPAGTERRRIDAVRLRAGAGEEGIFYGKLGQQLHVSSRGIELIEVKRRLNRGGIGQAVAAREMFERQYGARPSRVTIVCEATDPGLAWVCRRMGIVIWCGSRDAR